MYQSCVCLAVMVFLCCLAPQANAGLLRDLIKEHRQHKEYSDSPDIAPRFADVAYGDDKKQVIDVYGQPDAHNSPIIIMVHGGGWRRGDKTMHGSISAKAAHYVKKGYIFISIDYRLMPTPPDKQAQDVASAVAMVQNKAQSWGGDPSRIVLMGHSAGAHLVSLLSAHPSAWKEVGLKPWAGTISLDSAALDLVAIMSRKHMSMYDDVFGVDKEYWSENSPLAQLSGDALDMLVVCSTTRKDDSCANAQRFVTAGQALRKEYQIFPVGKDHGSINADLGNDPEYTMKIDHFIESAIQHKNLK